MPIYTRETLPQLLTQAAAGASQVFLLFGDRYLCQNAGEQLEQALLQNTGGVVHPIDGDQEDLSATLAKLRSFSLLPGRQIYRVTDTRLFLSKQVAKNLWDKALKAHGDGKTEQAGRALRALIESGGLDPRALDTDLEAMGAAEWQQCFGFARPAGDLSWTRSYRVTDQGNGGTVSTAVSTDPAEMLSKALASGFPANNILLLLAEDVDKRKKLFKLLKEEQTVIDLSVETGAGAKAQKEQKTVLQALLQQTLKEQDKTMAPGLAELLFDRVGFHPVALVMELRKVMLFLGERRQVTREDLDQLIGRTRQEALFELTTAIARSDREQALAIGNRLQENGIHPLAVVATLRNFVRGLLLFRALQEQPDLQFQPAMSAASFQQNCLPRLKEHGPWKKELSGHPFALYMQFKAAASYSLPALTRWMQLLLSAEFRLKGSPIGAAIVLQHLILAMLTQDQNATKV
jgi:DNA polymerase-3 subunit delta